MYATVQSNPRRDDLHRAHFDRIADPEIYPQRTLHGSAASHVGLVRMRNEDAWTECTDIGLFVVCDGMGGHLAGDVASRMAVETVEAEIADTRSGHDNATRLRQAIWRANRSVFMAGREPDHLGMGTTLVALWIDAENGVVAHVGDSRLYRLRDGNLEALTLDHSPVGDAVRRGRIDRATADLLASPPVVTRSLGASVDVVVECTRIDVRSGDRYLLCTDGLTDLAPLESIRGILIDLMTADDATTALVHLALEHGGHDNVTALVVDVE